MNNFICQLIFAFRKPIFRKHSISVIKFVSQLLMNTVYRGMLPYCHRMISLLLLEMDFFHRLTNLVINFDRRCFDIEECFMESILWTKIQLNSVIKYTCNCIIEYSTFFKNTWTFFFAITSLNITINIVDYCLIAQ